MMFRAGLKEGGMPTKIFINLLLQWLVVLTLSWMMGLKKKHTTSIDLITDYMYVQ